MADQKVVLSALGAAKRLEDIPEEAKAKAHKMNAAVPGSRPIDDLAGVQNFFDVHYPVKVLCWDPRLSKSECVPMQVAGWFVLVSGVPEMDPPDKQISGVFVWFERWCVNLLMALHKLRKA